ncbi:hypothetical protein MtrunA17_Chr5g0398851 [Medicago truncatula]|uniref:Uncharacterized protein n=1 Tax=Medicago truncatula TaxID=3880 RepID=A0A396HK95_MEDTR|nr:hypothetical protein MtrunA17_Chr5g0398851 [Medicago truncatula]
MSFATFYVFIAVLKSNSPKPLYKKNSDLLSLFIEYPYQSSLL